MPGLIRGIARTAVVAGTATAVSGRVQRRQAARYAEQDAHFAAQQQQAYDQQYAAQQQQYVPQQPAAAASDPIQQLKELGALKEQGILTEAEFAAQKAKILGS